MSGFQIKMDPAYVRAIQETLVNIKNGGNIVVAQSINDVLGTTRTAAKNEILSLYALPSRYITDRLKVIKANRNKLTGRITTPWRGMMLTRYKHSFPKIKAPWVEVKKGIKKSLPGAFRITFANSTTAIAFRPSGGGKYSPNWGDLYITRGPSVSQAFKKVQPKVQEGASEKLLQRLEQNAQFLLSKQK